MLVPVPSQRLPLRLAKTASVAPLFRASARARTFSPYDVVLRPARAPRSLRGQGTVATAVLSGQGVIGAATTTSDGGRSPRSEPSGEGPPVYVTRTRPSVNCSSSSTTSIPRRTCSRSTSGSPRPRADRSRRARWRSSAKVRPSTTLSTSKTPSPTVSPWSSAPTTGASGSLRSWPFTQVRMGRNYPRRPELVVPRASAMVLFASPGAPSGAGMQADVAQLVERNLAKVEVASSSLVVRSERVSSPSSGGLAERRGNGLQIRVHGFKSRTHLDSNTPSRAIGAAVARFLDTEEVTGSNPVSPTREKQPLTCEDAESGAFLSATRVGYVSDAPEARPSFGCACRRSDGGCNEAAPAGARPPTRASGS